MRIQHNVQTYETEIEEENEEQRMKSLSYSSAFFTRE